MIEVLRRESIYLWYYISVLFRQIAPYWGVGIVLGSVISVFLKSKITGLFLSLKKRRIGIWGIIPAALLGIASPLCMYGTVPLLASFASKGMREDWIAAFAVGSVLLNPQLLFYSASLGMQAVVIRFAVCFFCAIAAGLCVAAYNRKNVFFSIDGFTEPQNRDVDVNPWVRLLKNIGRNIRKTCPYFMVGILLSALFQRYVPTDAFASLFGENRGFGVLTAAALGVPAYACGGGTVPLLQTWLEAGMSIGSAAAFMITGPATKLTNLGALKTVLGLKKWILYLVFILLFGCLAGCIVNILL